MIRRILFGVVAAVVIVLGAGALWLWLMPPELLRVGDGYAAKIVCSNVYLAGRDPGAVLDEDVQAPGNPLLRLVRIDVDADAQTVTARMLGLFATGIALYRPGLGCAAVPDGDFARARTVRLAAVPEVDAPGDAPWPEGDSASPPDPALAPILADPALTGPGMRAVVVVRDGRIVGETYGDGVDAATPLLGWSMTKTVNALILGRAMVDGKLGLNDTGLFPEWQDDGRKAIGVRDLLAMTSGLQFNEDYGDVSDATRMLYLEPDMAAFAADQPLIHPPGTAFSYSTGTGVLLARLWMDRIGGAEALMFPATALFDPLGMTSAVYEPDEAGTFVGGSYLYATAHDWARVGQFLLQGGRWNGEALLPEGFAAMMRISNGLPGGYTQLQTWLVGPTEATIGQDGLPADTFWMIGHDGQSIAIVPSRRLVVVRLGLTPSDLGYGPEKMVKAIVAAADAAPPG